MAYEKQNWENFPSTETPITAERLNHMEDGIEEAWNHGGGGGAGETLPIGSELDFDGNVSDIPDGWEQVDDVPVYSTSETVCGTWIDGKPIYRKVVYDTTPRSAGNYSIAHGIQNYDEIVSYKTLCYQSSSVIHDGSSTSALSGSERVTSYFNDSNISIRTSWAIVKTIIIIEYTKTTD